MMITKIKLFIMYKIVITTLLSLFFSLSAFGMKVFDMEEIRDPSTLQIKVLQDWHKVQGPIATRQKLVTINVGDLWPGQEYRVPVRMVVPTNRKAKGFHLTGGSSPSRLQRDARPNPTERKLLEGGVGLVITVVQEPGSYGQREMANASENKFAESLNPRFTGDPDSTLQYLWCIEDSWKLLVRYDGKDTTRYKNVHAWDTAPVRLYKLKTDPHEKNDVAEANPHIVKKLSKKIEAWHLK